MGSSLFTPKIWQSKTILLKIYQGYHSWRWRYIKILGLLHTKPAVADSHYRDSGAGKLGLSKSSHSIRQFEWRTGPWNTREIAIMIHAAFEHHQTLNIYDAYTLHEQRNNEPASRLRLLCCIAASTALHCTVVPVVPVPIFHSNSDLTPCHSPFSRTYVRTNDNSYHIIKNTNTVDFIIFSVISDEKI